MKTRIETRREVFASNQAYILQVANLTEIEHNQIVYETGIQFLRNLYPEGTSFEEAFSIHERSVLFWNWWKAEFKKWESEFLDFLEINKVIAFSLNFYKRNLKEIHKSKNVDHSFYHNYLTKYKHQMKIDQWHTDKTSKNANAN